MSKKTKFKIYGIFLLLCFFYVPGLFCLYLEQRNEPIEQLMFKGTNSYILTVLVMPPLLTIEVFPDYIHDCLGKYPERPERFKQHECNIIREYRLR